MKGSDPEVKSFRKIRFKRQHKDILTGVHVELFICCEEKHK